MTFLFLVVVEGITLADLSPVLVCAQVHRDETHDAGGVRRLRSRNRDVVCLHGLSVRFPLTTDASVG